MFLLCCRIRPYIAESTGSRPISKVKLLMARLVVWWETTCESLVLYFCFLSLHSLLCCVVTLRMQRVHFLIFFLSVSHTTKNESPLIFSTTLLHSLSVCRQILLLCCVVLSLHFFWLSATLQNTTHYTCTLLFPSTNSLNNKPHIPLTHLLIDYQLPTPTTDSNYRPSNGQIQSTSVSFNLPVTQLLFPSTTTSHTTTYCLSTVPYTSAYTSVPFNHSPPLQIKYTAPSFPSTNSGHLQYLCRFLQLASHTRQ